VEPDYDDSTPIRDWRARHPAWHDDPVGGERRVAHIGHPETAGALLLAEPSLAEIPADLHEDLLARLFPVSRPAVTQQLRIVTATGEAVHLSIIGIPLTGPLFERMMQGAEREQLVEAVDQALSLARELGCEVVGFGGYTSIVTMNCTTVATTDVALTSGNAFTTAMTIEGLRTASIANGLDPADAVLGVVGARGNIGAVCARVLAKDWHRIHLIGRAGSEDGLRAVAETLYADAWEAVRSGTASGGVARAVAASASGRRMLADRYDSMDAGKVLLAELDKELGAGAPVTIHTSLDAMSGCDAILTATNSSRPIIFSNHLSGRTKVICDAAVPADVDASVMRDWPTVTVLSGGLVRLPRSPGIQLLGSRLPRDHVYGCVAETALLGVTGCTTHFSFGELLPEQVTHIAEIARRHGFELGALKAHEVVPIPAPVAGSKA
jgi:predicted amino acid dehydrogenase